MTAAPDPIAEARDQRRLAEHWADNAVVDLRTVEDVGSWIVGQRDNLARVDRLAPAHFQKLKDAIAKRWGELEHA